MQLTVITGLSGAGKTQVMRYLEDMGFFCIDNMPPVLIDNVANMFFATNGKFEKVAFVVDTRAGEMLDLLLGELSELKGLGYECKLLFLDASDDTIVKRYKETRRAHPVPSTIGLLDSIQKERKMLEKLYNEADYVIDTTSLPYSELTEKLRDIYLGHDKVNKELVINVMAFGFKYGVPLDADLMFDVRCFPNPFYIDELKELTGNDKAVQDYVMKYKETQDFLEKLYDMMIMMLPLYEEEGKSILTIAIGCTGGKHRSVTLANKLGEKLNDSGYKVNVSYRDISKGKN